MNTEFKYAKTLKRFQRNNPPPKQKAHESNKLHIYQISHLPSPQEAKTGQQTTPS